MEIIDELEPVTRGPYTGALGYLGFNRESQLSIAIRTAILQRTARPTFTSGPASWPIPFPPPSMRKPSPKAAASSPRSVSSGRPNFLHFPVPDLVGSAHPSG